MIYLKFNYIHITVYSKFSIWKIFVHFLCLQPLKSFLFPRISIIVKKLFCKLKIMNYDSFSALIENICNNRVQNSYYLLQYKLWIQKLYTITNNSRKSQNCACEKIENQRNVFVIWIVNDALLQYNLRQCYSWQDIENS